MKKFSLKPHLLIAALMLQVVCISPSNSQTTNANTNKSAAVQNNASSQPITTSAAIQSTVIVEDISGNKSLGFSIENGLSSEYKPKSTWIVTSSLDSKENVYVYFSGVRIKAEVKFIDRESDISLILLENTVIKAVSIDTVKESQLKRDTKFFATELVNNKITHRIGSILNIQKISGVDFLEFSTANSRNQILGGVFSASGNIVGLISNKYKPSDSTVLAFPIEYIKSVKDSFVAAEVIKIIAIDDKFKDSFGDDFVKWIYSGGVTTPQQYLMQYREALKILNTQSSDAIDKHQQALFDIAQIFYKQKYSVSSKTQTPPKNINLICQLASPSRDHQQQSTYVIDFASSTVNGNAATISDNQIRYSYVNSGTTYNIRIDRISGYVVVGSAQFPMLLSGNCTKSEGRSF